MYITFNGCNVTKKLVIVKFSAKNVAMFVLWSVTCSHKIVDNNKDTKEPELKPLTPESELGDPPKKPPKFGLLKPSLKKYLGKYRHCIISFYFVRILCLVSNCSSKTCLKKKNLTLLKNEFIGKIFKLDIKRHWRTFSVALIDTHYEYLSNVSCLIYQLK